MRPGRIIAFAIWTPVALGFLAVIGARPARAADHRAIFGLTINEVKKGEVLAVLRGDDVLLRVEDLEAAGITGFAGKRETIAGKLYVSLASLAPMVKFEIDPRNVVIKLTAQASYLGTTTIDLQKRRAPQGLIHADNPSAFFNYSVNLPDLSTVDTFGELGVSLFGTSLFDSTVSLDPTGTMTRGITTLTVDDPKDLRRLTVGDVATTSFPNAFGGSELVGGISLSRNFQLDPYFVPYGAGRFTGEINSPSTVEVYVNGVLVHKETLPPGVFTLQNIPQTQGSGNTQVVVRDAFGREQQFNQPYYFSTGTLAPGLSTYNVTVGAERDINGSGLDLRYGKLAMAAGGSYGLLSFFTPAAGFESDMKTTDGGTQLTLGTPLGTVNLSGALSMAPRNSVTTLQPNGAPQPAASSGHGSVMGYAAGGSFGYIGRKFSFGGSIALMSTQFANLNLTPEDDRATLHTSVSANYPLTENVNVGLQWQHNKDRDQGLSDIITALADWRLGSRFVLFLSGSLSSEPNQPNTLNLFGGLSYFLGSNTVAQVNFGRQTGGPAGGQGNSYGVQVVKSPPLGPGFGYLLSDQSGPGFQEQRAELLDRGDHGYYQFDFDKSQQSTYSFLFAGSVVAIGGRVFAAQPVESAYVLIRTPAVKNVEGYLYHQPAGRTDANGDLLVTQLVTPYLANDLSINDRDIPINYRIDATELFVAPPYRGGGIAAFPVRPLRSVLGKLKVRKAGKLVIPAYGTLTVTAGGKTFSSPIGRDGAFFLDSPPWGKVDAKIEYDDGTCSFSFDIPDGSKSFVRLGILTCAM